MNRLSLVYLQNIACIGFYEMLFSVATEKTSIIFFFFFFFFLSLFYCVFFSFLFFVLRFSDLFSFFFLSPSYLFYRGFSGRFLVQQSRYRSDRERTLREREREVFYAESHSHVAGKSKV